MEKSKIVPSSFRSFPYKWLIGPLIVGIILEILKYFKIINTSLSDFIFILNLNLLIPFWLLILYGLLINGLWLLFFLRFNLNFLSYNDEIFENIKWQWEYSHPSLFKFEIIDITANCTKCGHKLKIEKNNYLCPHCDFVPQILVIDENEIKKLILKNLKKNYILGLLEIN